MDAGNIIFLTLTGALVAASSAYVGSIMVLKRMSLVGDALSHVALPGMAIALALGISPIVGAFVFLSFAVLGIWYLEKNSDTYPEALVGLFFTASLAIGVLITKEVDLLEALFGSIEKISVYEGLATIALSLSVIVVTGLFVKQLMITVISDELAQTSSNKMSMINLLYYVLVAVIVSIGIRFVGTLLTGSLVIVPAVASKNISKSMKGYFLMSALFGIVSAVVGIPLSKVLSLPSGPVVVLVSVVIFIITFLVKQTKQHYNN